ncbi:MAG: hypothetical protein DDT31_01943 [Syntrophomonadaceae bacterium]|nr:hypothetical protein [Bacillota bacterium]
MPKEIEDTKSMKFYILGLSPNASRLSVRFWYVSTIEEISRKIGQHFQDLRIIKSYDNEPEYPGMWRLLIETLPKREGTKRHLDDVSPLLSGAFMRSIITGAVYPSSLLNTIIERFRADGDISYLRCAMIKAYLNRNNRIRKPNKKEVISMSLDKEEKSIGYRLGRLFAVLEKIQEEANPNINTTIKDRYYAFSCLMKLKNHHLAKLENKGRIVNMEKLIGEIINNISNFPSHLTLEEQGMFAIGYYHQKQDFYKKAEKKEE